MYVINALSDGLKILGFDKETIKKVSKEKHLEEIFLSTLFINYLLILAIFIAGLLTGGYYFEGEKINLPVLLGLLMVYPFTFNIVIYILYGLFGVTAEMLGTKKKVRPLLSVGFHTAIVYSFVIFLIGLLTMINSSYGIFLLSVFILYFIYTMFLAITTLYGFSGGQTIITIFLPFIFIAIIFAILVSIYPNTIDTLMGLPFK